MATDTREAPRYRCQPDPDATVPLAWLFKQEGRVIGQSPRKEFGDYKQIEIAGTGKRWMVHCSFAGALEFACQALGEGNVELKEGVEVKLTVPRGKRGSWIGAHGQITGFLKEMFGVQWIEITEQS